MITIKRKNSIIAVVQPNENVQQVKEISGPNLVVLEFSLPFFVEFRIDDYALVLGEQYYITTAPIVKRIAGRNYSYTLNMEGEQHKLGRVQLQRDNALGQFFNSSFFINDKAETFMTLLLRNIQRVFPGEGWQLGYIIDDTVVKNIQFDSMNCLEALNEISAQFDTEWLIEGRTIHLYRKTNAVNLVFKQGEGEALVSIEERPQDNSNIVNRLYVFGSNKNLPANYRNGRTRLTIGELPYIEGDTSNGVWEDSYVFEDMFPVNNGEVTAIDPTNPLKFTDTNIPFDVNANLQDNVTAKVSFETGDLAGYEFEINNYNHSTKTFTVNKNTSESAIDIPSILFSPQVGDKYFVFDIRMPESLVLQAEAKLKLKGIEYMDERNNNDSNKVYTTECNTLYFKRNGIAISLADSVVLDIPEMGINTQKRVVKLTRSIRMPYKYSLELANKVKENRLIKLLTLL